MILHLLFAVLPSMGVADMCYQCASTNIILNWSRYGLPMTEGETLQADDNCLHSEKTTVHNHCPGSCITYNVTMFGGQHDGKVLGVARMCASKKHSDDETVGGCEETEAYTKRFS